jgi:VanZ family protein
MQTALPHANVITPDTPTTRTSELSTTSLTHSVPVYVYAIVFASLCVVWGLLWDIMWHLSIGRDGLFAPPHLVIYVGAVVSGLFSVYQILRLTIQKSNPERAGAVRFWGVFYAPLGAMFCVWGALAMLTSAPFDDWWHNTFGLDVQILTPPHTILIIGIMVLQFGAMVGVLALQNQIVETSKNQSTSNRVKILFAVAAGLVLCMLFTLFAETITRSRSHHSSYYLFAAIVFPFFLLAVGRASKLQYPITIIAGIYMLAMLIPSWVLPLFPATPRLGPVLNPITHYQAFMFPVVLIVPGFLLDKLLHHFDDTANSRKLNDWWLAALAGMTFLLALLAVQWPFGEFLHTSPYARNWFFLSESWPYGNEPDWKYRYAFAPRRLQAPIDFVIGFGKAALFAMLSARVGLVWGNWMKRVQR